MKNTHQFKVGDKVFAKIKGYPPWPAIILKKIGKKFSVQFYGTSQIGYIKPEDLSYFSKNKIQMIKGPRRKMFKDAIAEIEKAIATECTDGDTSTQMGPSTRQRKRTKFNSEEEYIVSENITDISSDNKIDEKESTIDNERGNITIEEDLPFLPNVKLVSELDLKNWIIYADVVKENPNLYKSRYVEQRSYYENQIFPVLLSPGKYVGLKLHKSWPLSFRNEYEAAMYDSEIASKLLQLKDSVKAGVVSMETDPDAFLPASNLTEVDVKRDAEIKSINNKYKRVERLRNESNLVEIDAKIKNCLSLEKANPKKAVDLLDEMLQINIDEIMLKKHSHVVEMIRRVRRYVGNTSEWDLSTKDSDNFKKDAKKLRQKADLVYQKFRSIVKLPPNSVNFWDGFSEIVRKFREDCLHLNNREVFILCAEPYSRQAIIEKLEEEEELQEAGINRLIEIESDNSAPGL